MKLATNVRSTIARNSPAILTGLGVAGLLSTTILAVKATPKALRIIDECYDQTEDGTLSNKQIVQLTWKCYIPTAVMGTLTMACIVSANTVSSKRNAALAGLYTLTEKTLTEYQGKVKEVVSKANHEKITDGLAKDAIVKNPVAKNEVIITGKGEMLCYDKLSGRYFNNDIENIRQVMNTLSRDLMSDMFLTLNDVYYELGLSSTTLGDVMCWHIDDGLIEPDFSSQLTDEGVPCLVMDFNIQPKYVAD